MMDSYGYLECLNGGVKGGKRKSLIAQYLGKKYDKILAAESRVCGRTFDGNALANREMIAKIAGSLFDATWERLKIGMENRIKSIDDDFEDFTLKQEIQSPVDSFWESEDFRQDSERSEEVLEESQRGEGEVVEGGEVVEAEEQDHFVDILLDKMIAAVLPEDLPEREQFSQRVCEPDRRSSPPISVVIMTKNLKVLTAKLGLIFEFQDAVIRLLTWRNPSGTVVALILHTFLCFNPMLLLILPLSYVLFGLMVPGYLHRHPLRRNFCLTKHTYGKSLFVVIARGGKPATWRCPDQVVEYNYNELQADMDVWEKVQHIKQTMEFVVNLRDLQSLMSASVHATEKLDKFLYGEAGFINEQKSTLVFLIGVCILFVLWCISPFINWPLACSAGSWLVLILIHPRILPKIMALVDLEKLEEGKKVVKKVERFDIVLDEPPEVRYLEVFEIYKQGLTPQQWDLYLFSSYVFDPLDKYRKSMKPPPGVHKLEEVFPPPTWSFDRNSDWEIDKNVEAWATERGLPLTIDDEYLVDTCFKRRRLTRKVVRYANPARKPSYR